MRLSIALVTCLAVASCKKDAEPAPAVAPAPRPQVKKPVDKTPLPPLAAATGGATGKPLWGTGFGGLGIDSPRAVATAGGDSYVVGYFDGEIDLGPAGKRKAVAAADPKKPTSDPFVVKLGGDG